MRALYALGNFRSTGIFDPPPLKLLSCLTRVHGKPDFIRSPRRRARAASADVMPSVLAVWLLMTISIWSTAHRNVRGLAPLRTRPSDACGDPRCLPRDVAGHRHPTWPLPSRPTWSSRARRSAKRAVWPPGCSHASPSCWPATPAADRQKLAPHSCQPPHKHSPPARLKFTVWSPGHGSRERTRKPMQARTKPPRCSSVIPQAQVKGPATPSADR